jgi:hypothetical protein
LSWPRRPTCRLRRSRTSSLAIGRSTPRPASGSWPRPSSLPIHRTPGRGRWQLAAVTPSRCRFPSLARHCCSTPSSPRSSRRFTGSGRARLFLRVRAARRGRAPVHRAAGGQPPDRWRTVRRPGHRGFVFRGRPGQRYPVRGPTATAPCGTSSSPRGALRTAHCAPAGAQCGVCLAPPPGPLSCLRPCFVHQVERCLGDAPEPGEAACGDDIADLCLAGLRAEREPDVLRE